jgi:CheY-like chemotaxis protein
MERVINILMVEDDSLDVLDAKRTLDRMNILYKMDVAKNGEEALQLLETPEGKPDIILLDLNMPKMNGLEFLHELRGQGQMRDVKIFIITKKR